MEINEILKKIDHTLLSQDAKSTDICKLCDEGIKYGVASVCIPPSYVSFAKNYVGNKLKICTVIGFPNGYNSTATKCYETQDALNNGCDEVDMVINIGWLKDRRYNNIKSEISRIKSICDNKILKVIIETCMLTDDEKIIMCKIVTDSGADFIKTSTGFSMAGANLHDIMLFKQHIGKNLKIKAAGGIKSMQDAISFVDAGADRLGTSRIIRLLETKI